MRDNPWARARRLAGNSSAAALLLRLYYWHDKTTYREDGRNWVGLSRKMWTEELFFSLDEYKNALARVKKESLVVLKRKEIGGLQRSWIALSGRALEVFNAPYGGQTTPLDGCDSMPGGGQTTPSEGYTAPMQWSDPTPFQYKEKKEKRDKKRENKVSSSRTSPLAKNDSGFEQDSEEDQQCEPESNEKMNACASAPENEEAMPKYENQSVYDVVPAFKGKSPLHKPDSPKALGRLWLTVFTEVHGVTAQNLTGKQEGMLKDVIKACPPDQAPQIVEKVIREWFLFTQHAKVNAAAFPIPGQPRIEFLLKYVDQAVSFAASSNHPKQEAFIPNTVAKGPELQSIANTVWKKGSLAHPEKASLEEAMAIFNDDTDVS